MREINGTGGLCMTCNNSPTCYHHATRGPAIYCEMFDNYVPPRPRTLERETAPAVRRSTAATAAGTAPATFRGLCMNCEHRTVCTHSRSEVGVWHCENYQ